MNQHRDRVPGVGTVGRRRRVVPGHHNDVEVELEQTCECLVGQFDLLNLGVEVPIFAPAIGTAHGVYKGKPNIAYDRIENISNRTELPLALHGGTGLTDDVLKRCIALGCAKVNISTQIKHTFIDSFVHYHQTHQEYEPLKPLAAQFEQMKKEISEKIIMFGGQRRAV